MTCRFLGGARAVAAGRGIGRPGLRGQLVERYLPLYRAIAASLCGRVADDAEFADYMQYAHPRPHRGGGQLRLAPRHALQYLRHLPHPGRHPQQHRQLQRAPGAARARLPPEEGAHRLDQAPRQRRHDPPARRLVREMADVAVIWALSYLLEGSGMLAPRGDAHYTEQFYDGLEVRQLKARMVALVDALPEQERRVISTITSRTWSSPRSRTSSASPRAGSRRSTSARSSCCARRTRSRAGSTWSFDTAGMDPISQASPVLDALRRQLAENIERLRRAGRLSAGTRSGPPAARSPAAAETLEAPAPQALVHRPALPRWPVRGDAQLRGNGAGGGVRRGTAHRPGLRRSSPQS